MSKELKWSDFFTPFTKETVDNNVPTNSGVYLLLVKYKSGKWECFYVGRAENLHDRLIDHLSTDHDNECIKENVKYTSGFYYAAVSTQADREGIEKALYDYYETECNINDPGGNPIHVNVPFKKE